MTDISSTATVVSTTSGAMTYAPYVGSSGAATLVVQSAPAQYVTAPVIVPDNNVMERMVMNNTYCDNCAAVYVDGRQLTGADVDRLHGPGVLDLLGTALFWTAEAIGTVVIALALAYGVVQAARWLRDVHRAVQKVRSER